MTSMPTTLTKDRVAKFPDRFRLPVRFAGRGSDNPFDPSDLKAVPKGVADAYVSQLEMTVMRMFRYLWLTNPRMDASGHGVNFDCVSLAPAAMRDVGLLHGVLNCASACMRVHGRSLNLERIESVRDLETGGRSA